MFENLSEERCSLTRLEKWRIVSVIYSSMHLSVHNRIYKHASGFIKEITENKLLNLKVLKTNLAVAIKKTTYMSSFEQL